MLMRETNLLAFSLLFTYEVIMGNSCPSWCPSWCSRCPSWCSRSQSVAETSTPNAPSTSNAPNSADQPNDGPPEAPQCQTAGISTPPPEAPQCQTAGTSTPYPPNSSARKPNNAKISTPTPHDGPSVSISSSSPSNAPSTPHNGHTPISPPPEAPRCQTAEEQKLVEDSELDVLISIITNTLQKVKLTSLQKKRAERIEIPLISHGASKLGSTGLKDLKDIVEEGTSCAQTLMPESLQFLIISGAPYGEIREEDFHRLKNLRSIEMELLDTVQKLPESTDQLKKLKYLRLDACGLEELTESLCKVTSLEVLELKNCKKLMKLPNCIGYLPCMERLVLDNAQSLEKLPDSFGNLSSLLHLHLKSCTKIRKLPEALLCPSLTSLEFINCISLEALPTKLTHFVSLRRLVLRLLKNLQGLPEDLGRFSSLEYLEIVDFKIRQLPQSFGSLRSLRELKIESCDITELPEGFGGLSSLEILEIKECSNLRKLCKDFTGVPSLRRLYVYRCGSLEGEWMDHIVKLPSIQRVFIGGSHKLIHRWKSTSYENCKASVHYDDNHRYSLSQGG